MSRQAMMFFSFGGFSLAFVGALLILYWTSRQEQLPLAKSEPRIRLILRLISLMSFAGLLSITSGILLLLFATRRPEQPPPSLDGSSLLDSITTMALPVNAPLPGVGWIMISSAAFFGGSYLIIRYADWRKVIGLILCIGSLTGLTIKELTLLRVKFDPTLAFNIEHRFKYRVIGRGGPFAEARPDQLEGDSALSRLNFAIDSLRHYVNNKALTLVFVTGGADKRQLMSAPRSTFGSNENLAKARALWVMETISRQLGELPIIPLVDGSSQFGPGLTQEQLADDRYVRLIALVHSAQRKE